MELLALLVMPSLMLSEIANPMWLMQICWLLWGIHFLESTAKKFKCPLDSQLIWIFPLFSKLHYYIYPCSNSIKSIKIYRTNFHQNLSTANKKWLILNYVLAIIRETLVGKYEQKIQMSTGFPTDMNIPFIF